MPKIQRALISVTDKAGIDGLGRALVGFGVEILSTGGTARSADADETREVSDFRVSEMLDGRVKPILNPRRHIRIRSV
jgi:phosphoribosylaminoimidazolecarboxamide formyltransferase/IMP cyclohydrolase